MKRLVSSAMLWLAALLLLTLSHAGATEATGATSHLLVSFASGDKMLLGYLYRPPGKGPFPGVIFHHGHHESLTTYKPTEWEPMAQFLTAHGYMLFVPDRHPNAMTIGEYSESLQKRLKVKDPGTSNDEALEKYEIIHRDIVASMDWFKRQPDLDTNNIVLAGQLAGAQYAMYQAESLPGVRAFIAFSPGVFNWKPDSASAQTLMESVQKATVPVFLIFTENQSLAAAEALGPELQKKGKPNRMKIYSAAGNAGRNFVRDGVDIWGSDVISFLEETNR